MDSLYGGKPGISFVLKASYPSVEAMIAAFKGGANYTTVWYGEFALIDTPNKQDIDNGKIYRRGLDYQNSMGGAEYVGQIVGPSGPTPYFNLTYLEETLEHAKDPSNQETIWKRYPDENGEVVEDGDGSDIGILEFDTINALVPGKKEDNTFNDKIKYTWVNIRDDTNDAESWFYVGFEIPYLVIDYNIHAVSPYNELGNRIDLATIERIDDRTHPFWENWDLGVPKGIKGDTLSKLRVTTPNAEAAAGRLIYQLSAISTEVDKTTGRYHTTLGEPGYPGQEDDLEKERQILVFDYSFFDDTEQGTTVSIYVADYDIVTAVHLDDDGTLRLDMSHSDQYHFDKKIRWVNYIELTNDTGSSGGIFTFTWNNDDPDETTEQKISWIKGLEIEEDGSLLYTFAGAKDISVLPKNYKDVSDGVYRVENLLQWIKEVSLDTETGIFTVKNNRGEVIYTTQLKWVKDIRLDDAGNLTFVYTTGEREATQKLKWVTETTLNSSTGFFEMQFNRGAPLQAQLDWIDEIYIDEQTGEISFHHVYEDRNDEENTAGINAEISQARLKLIVRAEISDNGILKFITNTNEEIVLAGVNSDSAFQLKFLKDIKLNTGINDDKHIQVLYNTDSNYTLIGDPVNYIQDMVVRPRDWHLLVLYNDPEHRAKADQLDENNQDANGNSWINNVTGSDGTTNYGSNVYWRDYGTIKDQSGLLIGFNLTEEYIKQANPNAETVLDYLNANPFIDNVNPSWDLSNGLTGEQNQPGGNSTKGKIITYQPEGVDDVEFYAFDYNATENPWYYLGKIQDSGMRDARLLNSTDASVTSIRKEIENTITTNGLLFYSYNVSYSETDFPDYWNPEVSTWN